MRVLQVVTDTDHRGAQVSAVELGPALANLGHEVETVALAPGTSRLALDVPMLGTSRLAPATIRALRARARTADVVIAHGSSTLPACAFGLVGMRTPFVYRQISDSLVWAGTPLRRLRVRVALRRASAVVALVGPAREVLASSFGVPSHKLYVVPNAVSAERFAPVDDAARRAARATLDIASDACVVLSIGALVEGKRVDHLIDAVVQRTDPPVVLVVVGDGPEASRLREQAMTTGAGRVIVTGPVEDAALAYAVADLVALASASESMPTTLIEAALCGLPAVATDVGAVDQIILDGSTGLLAPDPSDPRSDDRLAAAISSLAADPARRQAMGDRARLHAVERFTSAAVAPAWDAVLGVVHRGR